jgi:hypothetical protein
VNRSVSSLIALVVLAGYSVACSDSPASLTVTPSTLVLTRLRESRSLAAEARNKEGAVLAGTQFKWRSSDSSVVEVDASGKATAVKSGRATVTVDAGGAVMQVPILVAAYEKLKVDTSALRLTVGESRLIDAHIFDEQGLPIAGRIDFRSGDEQVARVDGEGNVAAVGPGLTAIMLVAQDLMAAVPVAVTPALNSGPPVPSPSTP